MRHSEHVYFSDYMSMTMMILAAKSSLSNDYYVDNKREHIAIFFVFFWGMCVFFLLGIGLGELSETGVEQKKWQKK